MQQRFGFVRRRKLSWRAYFVKIEEQIRVDKDDPPTSNNNCVLRVARNQKNITECKNVESSHRGRRTVKIILKKHAQALL